MTDDELKLLKTYDIYIGTDTRVEDNDGWSIGDDNTSETDYEKYKSIKNKNLTKAKKAKNDDFYTQLSDIEAELKHYEDKFRGKIVYLPCDVASKTFNNYNNSGMSVEDEAEFVPISNFWVYFHLNFQRLGLKELLATNIQQSNRDSDDMNSGECVVYKYHGEDDDNYTVFSTERVQGNGDFRSEACRQLMKEADIIVTNPPFSLFREFVAQIMEFRKKFLIVGSQNCITYKEFFPLLKDNKAWMGTQGGIKSMYYIIPDTYPIPEDARKACVRALGEEYCKDKHITYIRGNCWFTNIDIQRKHEPMLLSAVYNAEKYPKYDNYDAIEVGSLKDIPCDYFGAMGVPITYFYTHCPDQFEVLDARDIAYNARQKNKQTCLIKDADATINGKTCYARIVIKRKTIPVEPEFLQSFVDGVAMTLEEVTDTFMDYSGDLFSTFFTNCRSELQSAKRDKNDYQILKSDNELEINCGSGYKILLGIADATHLTYTKLVKPEKEGA